jgi:hypothetical protein
MPALALAAENERGLATQTTLVAETRDQGGSTKATVQVTVVGEDGLPAQGAVAIRDRAQDLAGVALNAEGHGKVVLDLAGGDYSLRAVYMGDATHDGSASPLTTVRAQTTGTPDFGISIAPATLSLTAGQAGTIIASVTPINASSLTAPMFVTLSCSGFPDESSCTFTPENVEILPNTVNPVTSSMVFQTQAASSASAKPVARPGAGASPIAWAFLLPGALALAGLAWGGRRRRWLSRVSLLALVALVATLGTTACNPRYSYLNHGPPQNPATPAGTYTINVIAQSSNGVSAITHSTSFVLTVK